MSTPIFKMRLYKLNLHLVTLLCACISLVYAETTNPDKVWVKVAAANINYGAVNLQQVIGLDAAVNPLVAKANALKEEGTAAKADGIITEAEQARLGEIEAEYRILEAAINAAAVQLTTPGFAGGGGPTNVTVTGTSGGSISLALTETKWVSCKFGTGKGTTLGSLESTSGSPTMTTRFFPSGNYGTVKITATLTKDGKTATDSTEITISGQSEESARLAETTRYDAEKARIAAAVNLLKLSLTATDIFLGFLLAVAVGSVVGLAIAVAAVAVAIYACEAAADAMQERLDAVNDAAHATNLVLAEILPETDPSGGTENDN